MLGVQRTTPANHGYTRDRMLADLGGGLSAIGCAVRKWGEVLSGHPDHGAEACACCELHLDLEDPKSCLSRCPVGADLGCCGGHYRTWRHHQREAHGVNAPPYSIECEVCRGLGEDILKYCEDAAANTSRPT